MLRQYLPSVLAYSEGAEVIVADNASTDESLMVMHQEFPEVRTIVLDQNYGFAEGYNRALAQVEADYYLLLNSDVEVTPHWLRPLQEYMESHPECAACQPKLRAPMPQGASDADARFEYAGAAGGYIDCYGYPFCRGRIFSVVEKDYGQYDTIRSVAWATGAALLIRSSDWRTAGGLDGTFFAHQEEIDLCWRLRARGRDIVCIPSSVVYHVGGGTLPQGSPRKTYLNFRNNMLLLYKNLPATELHHVMRVRRWLDAVAALKELLTGHWENFRAIRRARRDYHRIRHDYEGKRRENMEHTIIYNTRTRVCVLWQYYVLRRRCYSDIEN